MKIFLTVLLSIINISLFAQVQPRSLLLNGGAALNKELNTSTDNLSGSFYPQLGYVANKHLVLGAASLYNYYKIDDNSNISGFTITPFARYYWLATSRWSWFSQLTLGYQHAGFNDPIFDSTSKFYWASLGGGFDYWLNSHIALEGILQYEMVAGEGAPAHYLLFSAGLQFFLPPGMDTIPKTGAVTRGARLIGFSANANWSNFTRASDDFAGVSLQPTLGFFINHRFVLGASLLLGFGDQNALVEPQPFVRFYLGGRGSVLQPFASAQVAGRFQLADRSSEASFFNVNPSLGVGVDWFWTPSVALEGQLLYQGRRVEEPGNKQEFIQFQLGWQFFLQP